MQQLLSKNMNENDDLSYKQKLKLDKWKKSLYKLENTLNYKFKDKKLLINALIHKSFITNSTLAQSEKLEFLGDSVLELAVTEAIYQTYPQKTEGELTKLRAKIISSRFLYEKAIECNLAKYVITDGSITRRSLKKNRSITADAMEALFGAIFLDSSFVEAKYVIKNIVLKDLEESLKKNILKNFKSLLQELSHKKFSTNPEYAVKKTSGPAHRRKFLIEVRINDKYSALGKGKSKKRAEQRAARKLLKIIQKL